MEGIIEYFLKNRKVVTLLLVFIVCAGAISLKNAKKQAFGTADYGAAYITTVYPGASPKDVERNVTTKIEKKLKGIDGISEIHSSSYESFSYVVISKEENADSRSVTLDIQKAVDQIDDFPEECKEPVITEIRESIRPTIEVDVWGSAPYEEKRTYARLLETKLLALKQVNTIEKRGYREREVRIELDQEKLKSLHVSIGEIINAIRQSNFRLSAGDLLKDGEERKYIILSEYADTDDLGNVILRSSMSGNKILLKQVARFADGFVKPEKIVRYNGVESIHLIVLKKESADMLAAVDEIRAVVDEFRKSLPRNVSVDIAVDYSKEIEELLFLVGQNALIGFFLVLFVLFLFLHYRIAFWTAAGIPVSIFTAFILFPLFDITINYLSLVAIIIVLGMLVDDAIIIAENIYRYREEGLSPKDAALRGVREVMRPVFTTILTTIIAFTPILWMTGTMKKIFFSIPLVVMILLSVSMMEAFFILPVHLAHSPMAVNKDSLSLRIFSVMERAYEKCLSFFLKRKILCIGIFVAGFVLSGILMATMKYKAFDSDEATSGYITFECPRGYPLERTANEAEKLEQILKEFPEDEISAYVTIIGQNRSEGMSFGDIVKNNSYSGNIAIYFTDPEQRKRDAGEIMADVKKRVEDVSGFTRISAQKYVQAPPVGKAVTVSFISNNDELRDEYTENLKEFLSEQLGLINIEDDREKGKEQISISFDYDMLAANGISPADIASTVQTAFSGRVVSSTEWKGEDVDFRVILNQASRSSDRTLTSLTIQDAGSLTIENRYGNLLPIGQFVSLTPRDDLLRIAHKDGERSVTVYADIDTDKYPELSSGEINRRIKQEFQEQILADPDIRMDYGGEEAEVEEAMVNFLYGAVLVIIAIYFILVVLFNSYFQPLLVMLAIPFSFSGVIFALFIHRMPFSIPVVIGLLGLMGVVVNDSLVMITFLNKMVREKDYSVQTLTEGAKQRFRPIFITTVTTAIALFPLAYGFGGGSYFAGPMVFTIAWGLIFATFITLLLLPVLYGMFHSLSEHVCRISGRNRSSEGSA